jgi:hypothetical protein
MQNKTLPKALMYGIAILILLVLAIIGFSGLFNRSNNVATDNNIVQADVEKSISITVIDQNNKENNYSVKFKGEKSVFELLKQLKESDSKFVYEYEESAYGVYINSFYGYKPESTKAYWEFLINGESSMVGVSDYKAKSEDEIKFKITQLQKL